VCLCLRALWREMGGDGREENFIANWFRSEVAVLGSIHMCEGRLKSSWFRLITPSRNSVKVQ
jgi:hypothetical protein